MSLRQRRIEVAEAERDAIAERAESSAALTRLGQRLEPYTPWLLVGGGVLVGLLLGRRGPHSRAGRVSRLARGLGWLRLAERLLPMLVPAAALGMGAGERSSDDRLADEDAQRRQAAHSTSAPSAEARPNEHAQHRPGSARGQQRLH